MTRPTLVLLPGNMCDARLFGRLALREGLRTAFVPLTDDETIEGMAAGALAAADGRLVPVGFSMGGVVAVEMARQAPDRIAGLALVDSTADADLPERSVTRLDQQRRVRAGALRAVVRDELKPNYLAAAHRDDASLKALLIDMAVSLGEDVFVRQSEALRTRRDNRRTLSGFEGPVFVACGAEDQLISPARHRAMAEGCRDAVLHILDDAGHMTPLEQPEALSTALGVWLERKQGELNR